MAGTSKWRRPALAKERTLGDVRAAIARVRGLATGCDVVHTHLPHDHLLARQALRGSATSLVRGVHHLGHLRPDPYHRWLFRGVAALGLANSAMLPARSLLAAVRSAPARVLPVALEDRFRPGVAGAPPGSASGSPRVPSSWARSASSTAAAATIFSSTPWAPPPGSGG